MSMWIWVLLPQHHTFSIQHPCPVPWPVLLLNKVFSWNNQDHPSKFSFNSKLILLAMPVGQLEIQKWKPADVDILHFIIKLIVQTIESTRKSCEDEFECKKWQSLYWLYKCVTQVRSYLYTSWSKNSCLMFSLTICSYLLFSTWFKLLQRDSMLPKNPNHVVWMMCTGTGS